MTVVAFGSRKQISEWTWSSPDDDHVVLLGDTGPGPAGEPPEPLRVTLRRVDLGSMPLLRPRAPW
jgi:hypothetical protein